MSSKSDANESASESEPPPTRLSAPTSSAPERSADSSVFCAMLEYEVTVRPAIERPASERVGVLATSSRSGSSADTVSSLSLGPPSASPSCSIASGTSAPERRNESSSSPTLSQRKASASTTFASSVHCPSLIRPSSADGTATPRFWPR